MHMRFGVEVGVEGPVSLALIEAEGHEEAIVPPRPPRCRAEQVAHHVEGRPLVDFEHHVIIDLGDPMVSARRLTAMDHHLLDLDVAREGEQKGGLRLDLASGPLVGRTALHVADEAGPDQRDVSPGDG